jgi:hypothetical protein
MAPSPTNVKLFPAGTLPGYEEKRHIEMGENSAGH